MTIGSAVQADPLVTHAGAAVARLLRWHNRRTGAWATPTGEAWQPALAIEAMINFYGRNRSPGALVAVARSFARYRGRRSRFFDDDGWYLNAWLRAYDVTGDRRFLAEAQDLFAVLIEAWDDRCGGGLWWHRERTYKNAITNGLFLLAAARLHRRAQPGSQYLSWAERAWHWFERTGLINDSGLVNDGLTAGCVNNGQPTWTYNQGVLLSGLVELWFASGDRTRLVAAERIADASLTALTTADGILREPSEPTCDRDQQAFKGVFAQGLARLHRVDRRRRPQYGAFLRANAESVWLARDRDGGLGLSWRQPAGPVTAATHISATLLLTEVARCSVALGSPRLAAAG